MSDWFAFVDEAGHRRIARKSHAVAAVQIEDARLEVRFADGTAEVTDTYDLLGFVANVLEDEELQIFITDPDSNL